MEPLASLSDVEVRLGQTFTAGESARPRAVLDDASALVRAEAGRPWADPDTGALQNVPAAIKAVVLRVAIRAIENPEGFTNESGGDYSYTRKGVEDGVYLTDREHRIIRRVLGRTGLWTQPVERGDLFAYNTGWVWDQYGTEAIPYDVYSTEDYSTGSY